MKIYTKTGDNATTSLIGGSRVSKSHIRLHAYGTVDELNSFTGLLITEITDADDIDFLNFIQQKLFTVGCYLATDLSATAQKNESIVKDEDIDRIEREIDRIDTLLPPLREFILPGGCKAAALAHVCRTVCRRVERLFAELLQTATAPDQRPFIFINRLSDYFFILARKGNLQKNIKEITWQFNN
ncbi:MAG: cob(I)yrinic acid a,c-diamide adenosyltransferase [Bacteroidales bacterium]|jgi:cob(I)alamin adenosyltransferase|nr:cob(I)yrinic acid a,c-diamide adenosyltransferase [Bacteroidales bacterium]